VRILLDTSVLVAAMLVTHPAHHRAIAWLQRIRQGSDTGPVSAHSLAELYAVLTRLPVQPRFTPEVARQMIATNVLDLFGSFLSPPTTTGLLSITWWASASLVAPSTTL